LSSDFSSIGVMQINTKVNSGLADKVCTPGQTVYDLECNINVGAKILRDAYLRYQNGIPFSLIMRYCKDISLAEKYASYLGWAAALRAYNGLGCSTGADSAYVERVNEKLAQISPSIPSS
ncbi:TPA: lytic transglycosylase domain-containing protein, partial [Candidatus Woesearchaeota archaeon]|nr:lytic transglycosylase domain-containing protein [Candidatus Woesearchaeota archaeon]